MKNLEIPTNAIKAFCLKNNVRELALFGSVLGVDFRSDSDIDVLVRFRPTAYLTLADLAEMEAELGVLFKRKVDLVEEESLKNPYRRRSILNNKHTVYAA